MILRYFLAPFLLHALLGTAQTPAVQWQNTYGGLATDEFRDAVALPGGGLVAVGTGRSSDGGFGTNHGSFDLVVVELDADGGLVWGRSYGGSGFDEGNAIAALDDGGFVVAGSTSSTNGDAVPGTHGYADFWLLRLSATGDIVWQRTLGGTLIDEAHDVLVTADGDIIATGWARSANGDVTDPQGGYDYWVVKLDADGDLLWQRNYGTALDESARSIAPAPDGGFLLCGIGSGEPGAPVGHHGYSDVLLIKIDEDGDVEWSRYYGGSNAERVMEVLALPDGRFCVAGFTNSTDGDVASNIAEDQGQVWVFAVDGAGELLWENSFGGTDLNDTGEALAPGPNGGVVVCSTAYSVDGDVLVHHGAADIWLIGLDAQGALLWQHTYGGSGNDFGTGVVQRPDGGYFVTGATSSTDGDIVVQHGNYDMVLIALSASTTGIAPVQGSTIAVWPSPTADHLHVRAAERTPYSVRDAAGRTVLYGTLHAEALDVSALHNGCYALLLGNGMRARFVVAR